MAREKKNQITIFLIKKEVTDHSSILENYESLHSKEITENGRIYGTLYFPASETYPPPWLESFFGPVDLGVSFSNSNTRAVYVVESAKRIFVLVFGYGKSMLKNGTFEDDFGLYTTLNLVDPDTLKSIDKTDLSLAGKKSKENLTNSGNMIDFGVNVEQDLLNEITGKSKEENLGNIITGRESFHTKVLATYKNIPEILEKLLDYRQKENYQENFEWVDNIKGVIDKTIIDVLNEKLIEKIKSDVHEKIWLAVPEVIVWSNVEGFKYGKTVPKNEEIYDDLSLKDFKTTFEDEIDSITINSLKNNLHVFCGYDFSGKNYEHWSIFRCLYCEIEYENGYYVLSGGRWYKTKDSFVKEINDKFKKIQSIELSLPDYDEEKYKGKGSNKGETGYNADIANADNSYILFDAKNINIGGGRNKVEFCDLYKKSEKQLIHIKRYGASSVFSHLFNQGLISAQLLLGERKFREKVNMLMTTDGKLRNIDEVKPEDYKIIFAVISGKSGDLDIPFFSKIALSYVHKNLTLLGFNVFKAKIPKS